MQSFGEALQLNAALLKIAIIGACNNWRKFELKRSFMRDNHQGSMLSLKEVLILNAALLKEFLQ